MNSHKCSNLIFTQIKEKDIQLHLKCANVKEFKVADAQGTSEKFSYPPFVEFFVHAYNETPEVSEIRISGSDRKECFFKLSHNINKADISYFCTKGLQSPR